MEPRLSVVTLGVSNLERSVRFYGKVFRFPQRPPTPSVAFFELGRTWLMLYTREDLAADIGVPSECPGFPGFTLAHNVSSPKEVDRLMAELEAGGARVVKRAAKTAWGGYSGYVADPDNYYWEIAHNPQYLHT